jgi:hypothetical protein
MPAPFSSANPILSTFFREPHHNGVDKSAGPIAIDLQVSFDRRGAQTHSVNDGHRSGRRAV